MSYLENFQFFSILRILLPDIRYQASRISSNWNRISGQVPDTKKAGYPAGRISGTTLVNNHFISRNLLKWIDLINELTQSMNSSHLLKIRPIPFTAPGPRAAHSSTINQSANYQISQSSNQSINKPINQSMK